MLKTARVVLAALLFCAVPAVWAQRGEGPLRTAPPAGITPQEIITRFAAKETQFSEAREHYTYQESVKVETLEADGSVDGEYQQTWDINFNNQGKRYISVVYAPESTLTRVTMTEEDFNDLQNLMPFVLTSDEIPLYDITYVGQQREDELDTYVFDVAPKHIDKHRRYFQGRIWVDNHDFQIVKTYGKSVPDFHSHNGENLFPRFTTYRQQIDNIYWFPTYTRADDVLHFDSGDVRIRIIVRYDQYKRFGSNVRVTYNGESLPTPSKPPASNPPQQ